MGYVALSADGQRAISACVDWMWDFNELIVWNVESGKKLRILFEQTDDVVFGVALSKDGRQ